MIDRVYEVVDHIKVDLSKYTRLSTPVKVHQSKYTRRSTPVEVHPLKYTH